MYTFVASQGTKAGFRATGGTDGVCRVSIVSSGNGTSPMNIKVYESFPRGNLIFNETVPPERCDHYEVELNVADQPNAVLLVSGGKHVKTIQVN